MPEDGPTDGLRSNGLKEKMDLLFKPKNKLNFISPFLT